MKIAVIGLGVAGLSMAARLAQAGHAVDGFEQFELMHARGSSHGDTRIMRMTPGEGEAYVALATRAAPIWRLWEHESGRALIDWRGGVMAGPPGSAFVRACAALSAYYAHPAATLTPSIIAHATDGGLRFPSDWEICRQSDCGTVHADAVRGFLIEHARRNGARLHPQTRMAPEDAAQHFDRVIVAAGGWAAKLAPAHLRVERRVLGWFKTRSLVPVICVDDEAGVYGMPTPDGLYKIGLHAVGEAVDPDDVGEPDAEDAALLAEHAALYLRLDDPDPIRMARCLYTLTPDSHFLIRPWSEDERVLIFSCCSGHGFKYAPAFGELALDWLEGRPLPVAFTGAAGAGFTPLGG
ncbi:MAG TPA: FAD-dependent oxidoreductase [Caulobacterales bacterium]|nr:FAD-dependent oxidoreductase [Caulobacterales bacterium]